MGFDLEGILLLPLCIELMYNGDVPEGEITIEYMEECCRERIQFYREVEKKYYRVS